MQYPHNYNHPDNLYVRFKMLAAIYPGGFAAIGTNLGKKKGTLYGYMTPKKQKHLWPLLPKMLAAYPDVSRQWLYFGEGPMFIGLSTDYAHPHPDQTASI